MRRPALPFAFGLAFAAALSAQTSTPAPTPAPAAVPTPSKAFEVLGRAVALYSDGSGHSSPFVQTYTPSGFARARRESGTVFIQAPERVRFDYTAPEKKVFTYDAGEGRFFSPADRQLTVRRLSEEEKARLPVVFLRKPQDLAGQYDISVDAGEVAPGTRLLLTPRVARPELAWLRLAIAPDGSVRTLSYQDSAGNRTEFRFESWRRGKARSAADFRITGPPGTRIVEN
ncbi:MAG: outer membrane lipoprotein carrier protein LolA [Acidobacteriota bacterium]|nr:outer membrane lipoprotein carrier protein LolA [Acidobacteriota bacterium]MDQ5872899.1 outer membrane lipoprotein carrier protein LolA [Acidobacteriota bacterium]